MKERPILFSGAMVRAILEGRKTQTRRVVKPQPPEPFDGLMCGADDLGRTWMWSARDARLGRSNLLNFWPKGGMPIHCPYGVPGDRLWVRETFTFINAQREHNELCVGYDADGPSLPNRPSIYVTRTQFADFMGDERDKRDPFDRRKYPGMFMNRYLSRITLEITDVRVQRLQDISDEDAKAEGVYVGSLGPEATHGYYGPRNAFKRLWDSINAKRGFGWDANPWVWAISFKRVL